MPILIPTTFTEFEFTDNEWFAASRFTQLNLMLLQTLIARTAKDKVDLVLDLQDVDVVDRDKAVLLFAQREAELVGRLRAFEELLTLSQAEAPTSKPVEKDSSSATSNSETQKGKGN